MKTQVTLKVLTASLLLAACTQTQTKQDVLDIRPVQEVQHGYGQARAQYELGRYYHGQLRFKQAIEAYRQALALNPGMADALNAMGVAYAESGNLLLARQHIEAALKLQPQSVYTHNNLGFVNYLAGDYAAAVEAYKQALRLEGGHEKSRQNLVLAYNKMGSGEQIARTKAPDMAVSSPPPMGSATQNDDTQNDSQTAWVKVSPAIYELRSVVAPAAQLDATPVARAADITPATRVATGDVVPLLRSAPAEPAVVPQAHTNSSAPVAPSAAAALSAETKPSVAPAVVKVAPSVAVAAPTKAAEMVASPLRGLEVSNGNGIRGMAARVARYFSDKGIRQARLTNQRPFVERRTRIEYRPGSVAEAVSVNKLLPKAAPLIATRSLRPDIRVRLVLGHDLQRDIAVWERQSEAGVETAGLEEMGLPHL